MIIRKFAFQDDDDSITSFFDIIDNEMTNQNSTDKEMTNQNKNNLSKQ